MDGRCLLLGADRQSPRGHRRRAFRCSCSAVGGVYLRFVSFRPSLAMPRPCACFFFQSHDQKMRSHAMIESLGGMDITSCGCCLRARSGWG